MGLGLARKGSMGNMRKQMKNMLRIVTLYRSASESPSLSIPAKKWRFASTIQSSGERRRLHDCGMASEA